MSRNLGPVLRRELANLDKDAESRRSAMKNLKSYVKDLDSKSLPHFLAQLSSSSASCTISLFEVLARSHGRRIAPQIDSIAATVVRTLSSSAGSFALHQACSRVVPAIARYAIDPATPAADKAAVIRSLSHPLADALVHSSPTAASGAALCLKALVEADNWRFASDELVNEVCLKLADAMAEKPTQTSSHAGLVMALAKHNSFVIETYARSFLRSGLQILTAGISESNSQKRFSAIQMINFLMKCVDSRSFDSELDDVIDVMEKSQADPMPFVCGAAFEALQTAKLISIQKRCRLGISSSPIKDAKAGMVNGGSNSPAGFASPESQTVDSFAEYDALNESPSSVVQSSYNFEYSRRASRRLWNDGISIVDISLKDGLFLKACSGIDSSKGNGEPNDANTENSEAFSGFVQASAPLSATKDTTMHPQKSQPQLTVDDIKICPTPRELIRSLQNPGNADSNGNRKPKAGALMSPSSMEVVSKPKKMANEERKSYYLHSGVGGRKKGESRALKNQEIVNNSELVLEGTESVSSTEDIHEDCASKVLCKDRNIFPKESNIIPKESTVKELRYNKTAVRFVCAMFLIFLSIVLSTICVDNNEILFDVVPT